MKLSSKELESLTEKLVDWTRMAMENSGGKSAVIGISGGKDSSVVAAICVKALGAENVVGVLMPDGIQSDISFAEELCEHLGIKHRTVNIEPMSSAFLNSLDEIKGDMISDITIQTVLNLPPRIRMTLLYAISQSIEESRVINTSNLSEDWVGYATIYGDTTGAFSPLGTLTSDEVIQVGEFLGLPEKFTCKAPSDGLTGKTDEDVFGFSYEMLNRYIREGVCEDENIKQRIDNMHKFSRHKFLPISMFNSELPIVADDTASVYKKKDSRTHLDNQI